MPGILALGRQRQEDDYKFLVDTVSSMPAELYSGDRGRSVLC